MSNQPPLILHVIHHLVTGGMENGLVNLINNIPASRYRHAVACIEDYSEFRQRITRPDVEVVALHRSRVGVWRLRADLYKLCRRLRPTIIHSRNMSGLDALVPARLAGVRHCIQGEHGWDVNNLDGKNWKQAMLRRLHSPLVGQYITVSKHLERYLVDRVGISSGRISQIYNGVNTERFRPAAGIRDRSWLPDNFRSDELFLIGTVGRIQPVKDQQTLLRAVAKLIGSGSPQAARLRLIIVGDGPLLEKLKAQATELGIDGQVHFPGSLDNVPEVLQSLDVFVLPSLNEGISNTILEAMACRLPVIATAVGGNVELIDEGASGRLFIPGDTDALAELLAAYLDAAGECQSHGQAALERVHRHYSLDSMVASYQAVYDQICGLPAPELCP